MYAFTESDNFLLTDFNQNWDIATNGSELPVIKFKGNSLIRSIVVTCGRTERGTAQLTYIFANFTCEQAKKIANL
jgi:hypothetical protein